MPITARVPLLVIFCLHLVGCVTLPNGQRDPQDPWERLNRTTYKVNDAVDRAVTRPIAVTYRRITPHFVQTGVSNFVDNLEYPITIVNELLQARFKPFLQDTGRLVINTTVGIGGLFDPATRLGLEKNSQDFGLTLGRWGAPTGPYLVIPILGPSDLRDGIGRLPDSYLFTPQNYVHDWRIQYGLWGLELLDTRTHLLDTEKALEGAYDRYAFIRNAYLQHRRYLVSQLRPASKQQEQKQYEEEQKILEESEGGESPQGEQPRGANPPPDKPQPDQPRQ
jgi:phospholipid-binding lipoprotein MlaA